MDNFGVSGLIFDSDDNWIFRELFAEFAGLDV